MSHEIERLVFGPTLAKSSVNGSRETGVRPEEDTLEGIEGEGSPGEVVNKFIVTLLRTTQKRTWSRDNGIPLGITKQELRTGPGQLERTERYHWRVEGEHR